MLEVEVAARPLSALSGILSAEQEARFQAAADRALAGLSGRTVWNVSSTATGGGVAEMLHSLLGYVLGAGVRTRWLVLDGDSPFFAATKRLHNAIHGLGGVPALDDADRAAYDRVMARSGPELLGHLGAGDLVLLHDPQTAGLVEPVRRAGIPVVWRSHIGSDVRTPTADSAWDFLRGRVGSADGLVFSRRQYAPDWVPADRVWVIPPSVDPLSAKNRPVPAEDRLRLLTDAGLLSGTASPAEPIVHGGPPPPPEAPLVVQVSRWDRLKDMPGVMQGFARMASRRPEAHLMLAGPAVAGVTDDPEQSQVFADCLQVWQDLPHGVRERVHLATLPTDDIEWNATIVNALQRHAAVVVQKSLVEGFGLTVTEAMWKGRPVVAGAVGGILDQIEDGRSGLLVDPHDLDAFAAALDRILGDRQLARRLGEAAYARVLDHFLGDRQLRQYAELFESVSSRG
ncbi:MAG TPA: glycosyltransferase [Mycobacteriales bacterium]|nr:glycosyltransferase [Mycobacteriales bacterium]